MAVGNQESTVFFANNRIPSSPTRSNGKCKPRSPNFHIQQSRSKLQLDLTQEPVVKGRQNLQGAKGWNSKGRLSPSKQQVSFVGQRMSPSQGMGAPFYAGFTESPAPGALPKPPSHWVIPVTMSTGFGLSDFSERRLSQSVKTFLDVHA